MDGIDGGCDFRLRGAPAGTEADGATGVQCAEPLMVEWCTVQSGPALNIEGLVEDCCCFGGVEPGEGEGDNAAVLCGGERCEQLEAGDFGESCDEQAGVADVGRVAFVQGVLGEQDSGQQSGDRGQIGRTAFKARRGIGWLIQRRAVGASASEEQRLQELLVVRCCHEEPDAGRSGESLVGGGSEKVHVEFREGALPLPDGLGCIQQDEGVMFVSDPGERADVLNTAGDIGGVGEDNQLCGCVLEGGAEIVGVEEPGVGLEGEVPDGDAACRLQVLQWAEDGVVIEF